MAWKIILASCVLLLSQAQCLQTPSQTTFSKTACYICEQALGKSRSLLENADKVNELTERLKSLCEITSYEPQCKVMLGSIGSMIPEMAKEFNTSGLCRSSGICEATSLKQIASKLNLVSENSFLPAIGSFSSHHWNIAMHFLQQFKINGEGLRELLMETCSQITNPQWRKQCNMAVTVSVPTIESVVSTYLGGNNADASGCSICKNLMAFLKDVFSNEDAAKAVRSILLSSCDILPNKVECRNTIGKNFNGMYGVIIQKLIPEVICKELNVCDPKSENEIVKAYGTNLKYDQCPLCMNLVNIGRNLLTLGDLLDAMQKLALPVCSMTPYKSICEDFIKNDFKVRFTAGIRKYFDPAKHCKSDNKVCSEDSNPSYPDFVLSSNSLNMNMSQAVECDICRSINGVFQNSMQLDKVAKILKKLVLAACHSHIPGEACPKAVNEYFSRVYSSATKKVGESKSCVELNFCPRDRTSSEFPSFTATNQYNKCKFCKGLVSVGQSLLLSSRITKSMRSYLTKTCEIFPNKQNCINTGNEFFFTGYKIFVGLIAPTSTCESFGACEASPMPEPTVKEEVKSFKLKNSNGCDICKDFVSITKVTLSSEKARNVMKGLIMNLCNGNPNVDGCKKTLENLFDKVYSSFLYHLDSLEGCKAMQFCSSSPHKVYSSLNHTNLLTFPTAEKYDFCPLCQNFVLTTKDMLTADRAINFLLTPITKVCDQLQQKSNCANFLTTSVIPFYKKAVGYIFDPLPLCQFGKGCAPSSTLILSSGNNGGCALCQDIVHIYQNTFAMQRVTDLVKNTLLSSCNDCPVAKKCRAMIENNFSKFYQKFLGLLDSKKICSCLDFCSQKDNVAACPMNLPDVIISYNMCPMCIGLFQLGEDLVLSKKSMGMIYTGVDFMCGLSSMPVSCSSFVSSAVDVSFQRYIREMPAVEKCKQYGTCFDPRI